MDITRALGFVLIGLCVATLAGSANAAQSRIALVVGNGDYSSIQPLDNPSSDARLIADTLTALEFEVVSAIDVDRRQMGKAVQQFATRIRDGGDDVVALFYYAGHGVQSGGENFLIPLRAEVEFESDLPLEALTAQDILDQMEDAGSGTNIVILDACRNNPYKGAARSAARGLARVSGGSGSLIAFSAAPGQTARDGSGGNSPYTQALAKAMLMQGLGIEQVFKRVLTEVEDATDGGQIPWVQSALRTDFYFRAGDINIENVTLQTPTDGAAEEVSVWAAVRDSSDPTELQAYLQRFPDGIFRGVAEKRLASLGDTSASPVLELSSGQATAKIEGLWKAGRRYHQNGDFVEAADTYTEARDLAEAYFGEDSLVFAQANNHLGGSLSQVGRIDETIEAFQTVVNIYAKKYGEESIEVASNKANLAANGLLRAGRTAEAASLWQQSIDTYSRLKLRDYQFGLYGVALHGYSRLKLDEGNIEEARQLAEQGVAVMAENGQKQTKWYSDALANVAEVYRAAGECADAKDAYTESLVVFDQLGLAQTHRDYRYRQEMADRGGC